MAPSSSSSSSSSPSSCARLAGRAVAGALLQILGLSLFVFGFFPVKPTLPGISGPESYREPICNAAATGGFDSEGGRNLPPDQLGSLYKEMSGIPPAFDRLIIMVVDGLPAEFVLGRAGFPPAKAMMESMPYTQSLLSKGNAIGFRAKAAPPTVTMPRLKAIVSGAIGGFLDVAFNFNTQAFLNDNLLEQLYHIGWKMVMHGDETWIKLFPRLFTRQDGVSSFFVKDTVEVDFNVSRHLKSELAAADWNLLILHYLGLDHVGHIGGRHCDLMAPKLKEMDEVIHEIYTSVILDHNNDANRTLLLVVSDHGMTDGGNHGGSSYEETDSLALFIGLDDHVARLAPISIKPVFQVDIAPTLALLFAVPIPKNSVGVLLPDILDFLTDDQKLRALELNSWQLLKLLQAQLPNLPCGEVLSDGCAGHSSQISKSSENILTRLCLSYSKAVYSHKISKVQDNSGTISNMTNHFPDAVAAYREFLGTASEWLSHRATDKPISLLAAGTGIMLASSLVLLDVLFCLFKEVKLIQSKSLGMTELKENSCSLKFDEFFIMLGILLHIISLGSSSMVEEEQYIWHFFASTLYLIFLYTKIRTFLRQTPSDCSAMKEVEKNTSHNLFKNGVTCDFGCAKSKTFPWKYCNHFQICSLLIVLICGRILRGWHQGGVNWTHLPDISKWLERSGTSNIKLFHIVSLLIAIILSVYLLSFVQPRRLFVILLVSYIMTGLLIVLHVIDYKPPTVMALNYFDNSIVKMVYTSLIVIVITVLASPWFVNISYQRTMWKKELYWNCSADLQIEHVLLLGIQDCAYPIGVAFTSSWCLFQLLLQHPLNSMPISLLFLQMQASIAYFLADGSHRKQWIEVAAMYFLGMAGHFGLGNSNSIATVDVAGAFTGLSSQSMVLAGILMFLITHASSLLFSFGMIMSGPMCDMKYSPDPQNLVLSSSLHITIGFRCLLPLVLNSLTLTSFTIVLLIMRNHLFVWSVFSPKYLYVCAATLSVYIGISVIASTGLYIFSVLFYRIKMVGCKVDSSQPCMVKSAVLT